MQCEGAMDLDLLSVATEAGCYGRAHGVLSADQTSSGMRGMPAFGLVVAREDGKVTADSLLLFPGCFAVSVACG